MAISYPTSLDSFTNPITSDYEDTVPHTTQHANANDAIAALETKLGADSSAVTTTIDYKLKNTSSTDPGHKHTSSSISGQTFPASGLIVGTTDTQTLSAKTLTSPTIQTSITVTDMVALGNLTGAVTFDPANGDRQFGTLTGNITITLTAPASSKKRTISLYLATGSGTFTIAFTTTVTWQDATTPTFTTTASKLNAISLFYDGSAWWGMGAKFA